MKNDKTIYLLRGLPGAGKSTLAHTFANQDHICEADDFLYDEHGIYVFTPERLKQAHKLCQEKAERLMQGGLSLVVSNTFTQEWEMEFYVDAAAKYGYKVVTLIVENRHGGKNIHGVPAEHMEVMRNRFQIKL
jgi:predicted kinase